MTPSVQLGSHGMSSHINYNENTDAGDHNRMSFIGDKIITLCSPDDSDESLANDDETLPFCCPSNSDEDDYDTRSITASKTIVQNSNSYSSYSDSSLLEKCETSPSYHPASINEDESACTAASILTPPVPLANDDMSSHIDCNESTGAGDHNRMSFVGDEIVILCSPDNNDKSLTNNETSTFCHPSNPDENDYNTRSIDNCSSYGDSFSLVKYETSLSCHPAGMNEDDHDCMSITAGEMTLQDSDNMSKNAFTNFDDILAANNISAKSFKNSESLLIDHRYESIPTGDLTSSNYLSKQSKILSRGANENTLSPILMDTITKVNSFHTNTSKDGHDIMLVAASERTQCVDNCFYKMSEHALTNVDNVPAAGSESYKNSEISLLDHHSDCISVPIHDSTFNYVDKKSDYQLTDGYDDVWSSNDKKMKGNEIASKDVNHSMSEIIGEITLRTSDKMSENASKNVDDILAAGDINSESYKNSEISLLDHHSDCISVPIHDSTFNYVDRKSDYQLTDGYDDVWSSNDKKMKGNEIASKDVDHSMSKIIGEITLPFSDKMSENASKNVDDILAVGDINSESYKNSEISLLDHHSDCMSVPIHDSTFNYVDKRSDYQLTDGYDDVWSSNDKKTKGKEMKLCPKMLIIVCPK